MKRVMRMMAAAVPFLAASLAFGDIANSKHDFSAQAWSDNQICKPCHTPHNSAAYQTINGNQQPITSRIWAHTLSTATYTVQNTASKFGTAGVTAGVDGATAQYNTFTKGQADMDNATRLCLGCHDGTVALDSFMGKNGGSTGKSISDLATGLDANGNYLYNPNIGGAAVGGTTADLSNDHPVGLYTVYDESISYGGHYGYKPLGYAVGAGLKFAVTTTALAQGYSYRASDPTISAGIATSGGTAAFTYKAPTYTNKVSISCVTCHDVHNGSASGERGLLRVTNANSNLCLTCHNK